MQQSTQVLTQVFPTIFTPQGDGNRCIVQTWLGVPINSRQYLPRKGTETLLQSFQIQLDQPLHSRQYLPRKGTETKLTLGSLQLRLTNIPDNIYPARGRKQYKAIFYPTARLQIPDNIYPARGRKHTIFANSHDISPCHIPDNIYPARGRKRQTTLCR